MNLKDTETLTNLMRAFAGESQARNRYTFAAQAAERENLPVIGAVFRYTAGQEKEHGEIFADFLRQGGKSSVEIEAGYPVDLGANALSLLASAASAERNEEQVIYPDFAETAQREGFAEIATKFRQIAEIEKCHAGRFDAFRSLLQENRLFVSDVACGWICLNCGYEFTGKATPEKCPVCGHEQGYFIRVSMSPYDYTKIQ